MIAGSEDLVILGKSTITGWGAIRWQGPRSDVLLGVTIDVRSDDNCREYYGKDRVHDSNLCLGYPEPEHSACNVSKNYLYTYCATVFFIKYYFCKVFT